MLALRSLLMLAGCDAADIAKAQRSIADVIVIDLAAPIEHSERIASRRIVGEAIDAIDSATRPVVVRLPSSGSGDLDADIEAIVRPALSAVILGETESPQDARDADVQLRKYELENNMKPGHVGLIPEIDSALGLQSLPTILEAVDRYEAVALNAAGLHHNLNLGNELHSVSDYAMSMVAIATRAADLPWIVGTSHREQSLIEAPRAHEFGAAGITIHLEASARGINSLFQQNEDRVKAARIILQKWNYHRKYGDRYAVASLGSGKDSRKELVNRRAMLAARQIIAQADAIAAREHIEN